MKTNRSEGQTVTGKQIAGGFLSPEWVLNPALAEPYVRQCAKAGFFAYILFVRQMKQTVLDPRVREAVRGVGALAHRFGLKFILDTDPTWWAEDLIQLHPEAAFWRIVPVEARAFHGRIRTFVEGPPHSRIMRFQEVSALYTQPGAGYEARDRRALECEWQACSRPAVGVELEIRLSDAYTGPVRLYAALSTTHLIDHAHPVFLRKQKELLDSYRDIPLDGVAWDEPGKGHGSLSTFRAGEGFLALFQRTNGYDLREKLIYLDRCDGTAEAVRVRCDYYRTLSDMHDTAQREHNDHARRIWGADLICGTHQTWSGLMCDLGAGVMDHFRLGKVLTAAWTDGGVDCERKTMCMPLMLADSLKKELGWRDSYYNDWTNIPRVEPYRFFNRFKTLFHVNTFTHVYSEHSEGIVNMRLDAMREAYEADVRLQDSLDALIGERRSDADVAIWYGWEGYAALPKWGARAVYTFMQNTALLLADAGLFGNFLSNEGILRGEIRDGRLCVGPDPYRVLIVPYAHALPRAVYEKLIMASRQGVHVVFVGPPPEFAEDGTALDFCGTIGVEPVSLADIQDVASRKGMGLSPDGCEPVYLDVLCPVQPVTALSFRNIEREIMAVKGREDELYWMPALDPRADLVNLISPWCRSNIEVFSRNAYSRTFSDRSHPDDFVLVLAPREGAAGWGLMPESCQTVANQRPPVKPVALRAFAKIAGKELLVSGSSWCAIRFKDGEALEFLADDGVEILLDGERWA